jgi:hypothetical protein
MAMSFSAADIQAMEDAIKTGELSVSRGDRSITYRSMDELMRALAYAKRQNQGAKSSKPSLANWQ